MKTLFSTLLLAGCLIHPVYADSSLDTINAQVSVRLATLIEQRLTEKLQQLPESTGTFALTNRKDTASETLSEVVLRDQPKDEAS